MGTRTHDSTVTLDMMLASGKKHAAAIVCAGVVRMCWSNGHIKRSIVFEHTNHGLHTLATTPPTEPGPFLKERWNPFNGFSVIISDIYIPPECFTDSALLLDYCVANKIPVYVDTCVEITCTLNFTWQKGLIKELIRVNQVFRNFVLFFYQLFQNTKSYITTRKERARHYEKLNEARKQRRVVLDLALGGLGDCLAFSTLPRLLSEQYDAAFYLSEETKQKFRHPDIGKLCFELNPYFHGYASTKTKILPQGFIQDVDIKTFLFDRGSKTAIKNIEDQFSVSGSGLPEIFYQPKTLSGYDKTLVCDKNWFSGEKWGLYNDDAFLASELAAWTEQGPEYRVEYITLHQQNIFEYIDKIYSAAHFVCYLSGGNSIAAALKKPALVLAPENLEGSALSQFLFFNSPIRYYRKKTLKQYHSSWVRPKPGELFLK